MNLKDKILLKIHLFLNEKYSNLFFDLLKNINLILKEEEKNNRKKIFNNILSDERTAFYFYPSAVRKKICHLIRYFC